MFVSVRKQFHNHVDQVQGLKHAARMWPPRAFCAALDAFWEFSYNQRVSFLVYSPVFESARPASEQAFFKQI